MNVTADKFISESEEKKLFKTISKSPEKAAIVDFMLFNLLSLTGLRISEALSLKWEDIGEDYIIIRQQKNGKKNGTIHIGNKLIELLKDFQEKNPFKHSPFLFNTQKGPMKRTSAHDRLKHYLKVANLREDIGCHSFRHTYATKILNAGIPLPVVRDQLRHSSIAVTSVYLHFSKENKDKLKEVV